MESNAVLQNRISFFFSFFNLRIYFPQPTSISLYTYPDKQAIYNELQDYPLWGREGSLPPLFPQHAHTPPPHQDS
jgi:hypothetical protein